MDQETQTKAVRRLMYMYSSECARLIDLAEGNQQERDVEGMDFALLATQEHAARLELLHQRTVN